MAGIESYTGLQDAIADWLLRTDLDDVIPTFIDNAESDLRRDKRVRRLKADTLTVDSPTETLPSDFRSLEGLWFDGSTHYGEITIVDPAQLGDVMHALGDTDVPTHAAVIAPRQLRFAPEPDDEYTLRMSYWATIPSLSDTVQSNWLLDDHPDVYLFASLVESAPYLRDDQRITLWKGILEERLERLHMNVQDHQYGGRLSTFPSKNIP